MVTPARTPWWKGRRGEWYVVAQVFLFALVAFGPRTLPGLPVWTSPWTLLSAVVGIVLMAAGAALSIAAVLRLGPDLTPLPYPKESASLVQTGPYALVRHPIYAGLIYAAFGWGLFVHGWLTLVYAAMLFVFFDIKSRREERWLVEKYEDYPEYRRHVKKLIPWIY